MAYTAIIKTYNTWLTGARVRNKSLLAILLILGLNLYIQAQVCVTISGASAKGIISVHSLNYDSVRTRALAEAVFLNDSVWQLQLCMPQASVVWIANNSAPLCTLAIDKTGPIQLQQSIEGLQIRGSEASNLIQQYDVTRGVLFNKLVEPINAAMREAEMQQEPLKLMELQSAYIYQYNLYRAALTQFVRKHMQHSIAAYVSSLRWNVDADVPFVDSLVVQLTSRYGLNNPWVVGMAHRAARMHKQQVGVIAPDFELIDVQGRLYKLKNVQGKYVLIDFWASWCRPCIQEIPTLRKAYSYSNTHPFEIVGVSLDTDKAKWMKALVSEAANWPNANEPLAWKSPLALAYGITFLPSNVLIGPDGRIVARNLRGKELLDTLERIFLKK